MKFGTDSAANSFYMLDQANNFSQNISDVWKNIMEIKNV